MEVKTDEQIARETIFGQRPQSQPPADDNQNQPPIDTTPADDTIPNEGTPPADDSLSTPPADTTPQTPDITNIPDEKVLELLNTKFNVKFDTLEAVTDFISNQKQFRGQDEIIQQLTDKLKETSNVLSYFPSENAYKVAMLSKEKYPGKDTILSNIIGSDVDKISDFEAIRLAEALTRPAGSKVDPLRFKLSKLGLRDLDVADFDDWSDTDKEVIYGEAEDAREALRKVQNEVQVPSQGEQGLPEIVSEIERGVQEKQQRTNELVQAVTPIATSLVNGMTKIKPVDGEDFEYAISLDNESKQHLQDFLVAEAIEGNYNLQSDQDLRSLGGMLESEIWATDGPKIMAAYGKYKEDKTWEQARRKYENAEPLNQQTPPADPGKTPENDNDRARRLLGL